MRLRNVSIINSAVSFTAQFGFLSRDIFFRYLCPLSVAGQYSFWKYLIDSSLFYESRGNNKVLHLTSKGFRTAGPNSIKGRSHFYIHHDSRVAEMLFILAETNLVECFWTEGALKQTPWDAIGILGGDNLEKLPDLVVDLKGREKTYRLAVEVEASLKTKVRYDQMAMAYLRIPQVDLILFVCENAAIELQVTRAFESDEFSKAKKVLVTTLAAELSNSGMACGVRVKKHKFKLEDVLKHVLGMDQFPLSKLKDNKNSFLLCGFGRKEAA